MTGEGPDPASAAEWGFDALLLAGNSEDLDSTSVRKIARDGEGGAKLVVDVAIDSFPIDHELVERYPEAFVLRRQAAGGPVDPRRRGPALGEARARLKDARSAQLVLPAIRERMASLVNAGAQGFRILRPDSAPPDLVEELFRELSPDKKLLLIAQSPGAPRDDVRALRGFDAIASSFPFWDLQSSWIAEEYEALRLVAPLVAEVPRQEGGEAGTRLLRSAAVVSNGLIVPWQLRDSDPQALEDALGLSEALDAFPGAMQLFAAGSQVTAIVRGDSPDMRCADSVAVGLINTSSRPAAVDEVAVRAPIGVAVGPLRRESGGLSFAPLAPFEVRLLAAERAEPIALRTSTETDSASAAAKQPRLVIERVEPQVDGGAFPVKRTVGDVVGVEAIVFADGHEQLAAELRWRAGDEDEWQSARMAEQGNDRWTAQFPLRRMGRHEFAVEAWLDRFGGYRRDLRKKLDAGVAQSVDFQEGLDLVEAARERAGGETAKRLGEYVSRIGKANGEAAGACLLDPELALLMDEADDRPFAVRSTPRPVESDRLEARFSSWYELFPRSQAPDPGRHGTFGDVIERLPQIRAMGFDTLYFPPIHPIGKTNRKGRNNSLDPAPDDPGSPYAIGSGEGGHTAVHPALGTLEDFQRLVKEARRNGMEIALDFAIQCSPDHPWLKEHPGWFDWRPDGSIKYAENPPKKYQDIVNVDFYKPESIPGLWIELRDVVRFWIDQGVTTFRVDNPHTKPFPFWEWLIGDIRSARPDVIFLAEAFTRPAIMYRLAKIGFSQSYTYFTWRTAKHELTEYLTELTTRDVAEFFRPHFFVNTPDINPSFLHDSGRPGFQIRAALAATLSGLFGVYSGFELCESKPVPGKEEYWESEKYEVKPRDWQGPGNIIDEITQLNRIRRAHPALQTHLGLTFYNAWNDRILYYGKRSPGSDDMILIAVSLDPHNAQEADFEVPLWEWGIGDDGSIAVDDLLEERRFTWTGKVQHLRLTPDRPYAIWRLSPAGEGQ